jgi:Domain of unknown function (DUF3385)
MSGKLLIIYICIFHGLSGLLLNYICKLHWNQAIKAAGLLGAVEQESFEKYLLQDEKQMDKDLDDGSTTVMIAEVENDEEANDRFLLSVIINSITKVLRDDNQKDHHKAAASIALKIIQILRELSLPVAVSRYPTTVTT